MEALFASGHVADLILVVLVLETVVLIAWHRRTGRGLAPRAVLALAFPGAALVIALRLALTGAWWGWIALALLAAFAAHLADIAVRWRS
jgi:hypothetical protein